MEYFKIPTYSISVYCLLLQIEWMSQNYPDWKTNQSSQPQANRPDNEAELISVLEISRLVAVESTGPIGDLWSIAATSAYFWRGGGGIKSWMVAIYVKSKKTPLNIYEVLQENIASWWNGYRHTHIFQKCSYRLEIKHPTKCRNFANLELQLFRVYLWETVWLNKFSDYLRQTRCNLFIFKNYLRGFHVG